MSENPEKHVNEKKADMDPFMDDLKIEAVHNGVFDFNASALNRDQFKMTPIIFCHGLMAENASYSRHALEMASHGYIVFCPNFHDGSCNYREKEDGSPVFFDRTLYMLD